MKAPHLMTVIHRSVISDFLYGRPNLIKPKTEMSFSFSRFRFQMSVFRAEVSPLFSVRRPREFRNFLGTCPLRRPLFAARRLLCRDRKFVLYSLKWSWSSWAPASEGDAVLFSSRYSSKYTYFLFSPFLEKFYV